MPNIPVNSASGYIGVFLILFGFFLILAGLDIIKIEKVTVKSGAKTWGFGIILAIFGLVFLLPDIRGLPSQPLTPTPSVAVDLPTPTATSIPLTDTPIPTSTVSTTPISISEVISADIYIHQSGLTLQDAENLKKQLEENGIRTQILVHRDPNPPDAIFIGALVGAEEARIAISSITYEIKYIFRPDYPAEEGGDPSGLLIGIGYMSTHYEEYRDPKSEPVEVSTKDLEYLTEPGLSDAEFQQRLREITQF